MSKIISSAALLATLTASTASLAAAKVDPVIESYFGKYKVSKMVCDPDSASLLFPIDEASWTELSLNLNEQGVPVLVAKMQDGSSQSIEIVESDYTYRRIKQHILLPSVPEDLATLENDKTAFGYDNDLAPPPKGAKDYCDQKKTTGVPPGYRNLDEDESSSSYTFSRASQEITLAVGRHVAITCPQSWGGTPDFNAGCTLTLKLVPDSKPISP